MSKTFCEEDVRKTYRLLGHHEQTEIRAIIPGKGFPESRFVSSEDEFVNVCKELNGKTNLYVGINERSKGGTRNIHIKHIGLFVADMDPERDKDTSATDEQVSDALALVRPVCEWFESQGFQHPSVAMTGNGVAFWSRLSETSISDSNTCDNCSEKRELFQKILKAKFSSKKIRVDSVHDPARIMKIPGTLSIKGDNHRLSYWIEYNNVIDEVLSKHIDALHPSKESLQKSQGVETSFDSLRQKDNSRSGKEWGIICKLIEKAINTDSLDKNKIYSDMMLYAKWSQSPEQYREITYNKALNHVKQMLAKRRTKVDETDVDFIALMTEFCKRIPTYYPAKDIWWMWSFEEHKWNMVDETDIMNCVDELYELPKSVYSHIKNKVLEALRRVARKNAPKEPEETWIQFKDTIVDVKTGESFKASSEYFFVNPVPWSPGESEETPMLDKFFTDWVVKEGVQDESYVQTLYEITAYSILSRQFLQRLFAFTGSGSNGKGSYFKVLTKFVGKENTCSTQLRLLTSLNHESSALYRKQVCTMGEVDSRDVKDVNLLKSLTGEDPIRYEFKNKTSFSEESGTTCFIATNSLPITPDKSTGYYRRWLIVDFPNTFPIGPGVLSQIPDVEFENLARKSIRILKELFERREFTNEGSFEDRMRRYEGRSNPIYNYIRAQYDDVPTASVRFSDFYNGFQKYLIEHNLRELSKKAVSKLLKDDMYDVKRMNEKNTAGNPSSGMHILGLRPKKKSINSSDKNPFSDISPF